MKKQGDILIVGGGITGLVLAGLLEKAGFIPEIVEKMSDWQMAGYGMTIMPAGLEVLRELGVLNEVRKVGYSAEGLNVMNSNGDSVHHFALRLGGIDSVNLARADLHKILRNQLQTTTIAMGQEVVSLAQQDGAVDVTFSTGVTKRYDLVIGADGIRSAVRTSLFPSAKPRYSGMAVWTFLLPKGTVLPSRFNVTQVWSESGFVGIFPFRGRAAVTLSGRLDTNDNVHAVDLLERFGSRHTVAKSILSSANNTPMYAGYLNEVKLRHWHKGRILLAGDAAHAMMPATGMGSSMGMMDARTIAHLIEATPIKKWGSIPRYYQAIRKFQVDRVQWEAAFITKTMFIPGPFKYVRNLIIKMVPQFIVSRRLNSGA